MMQHRRCFATFIITNSELLKEFCIISSLSIVALFFLCLIIIPYYSYQPRKAPETFESHTKVFMWLIGKKIDAMFIL
jgi:hypothetical protein